MMYSITAMSAVCAQLVFHLRDQNLLLFSPCNNMEALHSKVWDRMDKIASLKHSVTSCLALDLSSFGFEIVFW